MCLFPHCTRGMNNSTKLLSLTLFFAFFVDIISDKRHGDPKDAEHMAGDLGNITVDESGNATVALTETSVQLLGPHSVIGRSIVIYAGEDDRGRGGHESSQQTGNPGPRVAAGVIGIAL